MPLEGSFKNIHHKVMPSFRSPLLMDSDTQYLGNSQGTDGRGQLHTLAFGSGSIIAGLTFDLIEASYPDSVTEIYTYKLLTVTQAVVTIVYTDATKALVSSVSKT